MAQKVFKNTEFMMLQGLKHSVRIVTNTKYKDR